MNGSLTRATTRGIAVVSFRRSRRRTFVICASHGSPSSDPRTTHSKAPRLLPEACCSLPSRPTGWSRLMREPDNELGDSGDLSRRIFNCAVGAVNRGAAILGDTVFVATLDAYLVALDAATGRKKWETKVAEYRNGYSITGAPLALHDRVVVGIAGSEYGTRGFVAAFSAADGRPLWKFNTVPGPGELGHDTWAGESWKVGGAATWTTGAYDEDLDLVFWGVGNPAPLYDGTVRAGDNLFSCSVIALEARNRKAALAFSIHASRRARLGCYSAAGACTDLMEGATPRRSGNGEPQRILLRA